MHEGLYPDSVVVLGFSGTRTLNTEALHIPEEGSLELEFSVIFDGHNDDGSARFIAKSSIVSTTHSIELVLGFTFRTLKVDWDASDETTRAKLVQESLAPVMLTHVRPYAQLLFGFIGEPNVTIPMIDLQHLPLSLDTGEGVE